MKKPLVAVVLSYVIGLVITYYSKVPAAVLWIMESICLALAAVAEIRAWRGRSRYLYLYLSVLVFGAIMLQWQAAKNSGNIDCLAGRQVTFEGTVCAEPDFRGTYTNYIIELERIERLEEPQSEDPNVPKGRVLLMVREPAKGFWYGDRLAIQGVPELPKDSGNPGDFDYRKYLQAKGIQLIVKSWSGAGVSKTGIGGLNLFVDLCLQLKQKLMSVTIASMSSSQAALVKGILFGSSGTVDNDIRNDFALSGVVHILSVSGYHVALLVALCMFITDIFGLNRYIGNAFTVAVTLAYTVMTGASPPAVRALVMAWVIMLARWYKREYDWPSALSLAALVILLIDPVSLMNTGFQLSFAATWGILYLSAPMKRFGNLVLQGMASLGKISPAGAGGSDLSSGNRHSPGEKNGLDVDSLILSTHPSRNSSRGMKKWLGDGIVITLAAQLAVFPLTSYYFSYFSGLAIPANLLIVPMVTMVMLLAGLAAVTGMVWLPLAQVLNISTGVLLELILKIAHILAGLPLAVITVRQPGMLKIAGFYVLLFMFVEASKHVEVHIGVRRLWQRNRPLLVIVALSVITVVLWTNIFFPGQGLLQITFLDVGQGDAIVLQSPGGQTAVIDTGGIQGVGKSDIGIPPAKPSFNPGEKILIPYLRRIGVNKIDMLILSHAHADHIQGAEALLNTIPVDTLAVDPQFSANNDGGRLVEDFRRKGTEIIQVCGGNRILLDENISFETVSPRDGTVTDENNDSLIIRLCYGEFHVLFTGDAGETILANLPDRELLHAEVVKVPHHGSKNSWSDVFYKAVGPEVAVVSVGPNRFGHPSYQVLDGLKKMGVVCYRTDNNGAVIVRSDGRNYDIRTGK